MGLFSLFGKDQIMQGPGETLVNIPKTYPDTHLACHFISTTLLRWSLCFSFAVEETEVKTEAKFKSTSI